MQIEVKKKENIEEDGEGKQSKKTNMYSWSLDKKKENDKGTTSEKAQEHKKILSFDRQSKKKEEEEAC